MKYGAVRKFSRCVGGNVKSSEWIQDSFRPRTKPPNAGLLRWPIYLMDHVVDIYFQMKTYFNKETDLLTGPHGEI